MERFTHGSIPGFPTLQTGFGPAVEMERLGADDIGCVIKHGANIKGSAMKGDASGSYSLEKGTRGQFIGLDGTGVPADGIEGVGVRAGDKRLVVLMGPACCAEIGINPVGQPADMQDAPLHGIDAVDIGIHRFAEAGGVGIKGMGGQDKQIGFAGPQGPDFIPGGIAG